MASLGLFLVGLLLYILVKAHFNRKSKIDLSLLLVDNTTGNVTLAKFGGLGAFIASTWVFIYLAVANRFDATYASAYLLAWGAVKVAGDFVNKDDDKGNK